MEGPPRQSPACLEKCASHRPPEQEEKGSGALARVPRGRHYLYGLESKTAPEGHQCMMHWQSVERQESKEGLRFMLFIVQ
ncbi:hypothetical protein J6590_029308 [Homalodisca vitripennis]|nr:hypothetical protein J6590_029308 [Homalodisca vitripennis]